MKFGLCYPVIARYVGPKQYADGFVCGEAMNTDVTPQYGEGSAYGDNKLARYRRKFKNATVKMGTTYLPVVASSVMFGHKVGENDNETYNTNDENNYVGYGFISKEERGGKTEHIACILYKVLFSEGTNSYITEGENISFNTPSVDGVAMSDDDGDWMDRQPFATEKEAMEWLKGKLGIVEKCVKPVASLAPGSYDAAQSVTLTASDGGTVYYTLDGTTPNKSNGTKATSAAISISKTTMLRAVNTAAGKADSDILSAEYVITAM